MRIPKPLLLAKDLQHGISHRDSHIKNSSILYGSRNKLHNVDKFSNVKYKPD